MATTRHSPWGALISAVALISVVMPTPAHAGTSPNGDAAVTWPAAFSEYTMADGSIISDAQDNNPSSSDIWAGPSDDLPSTYFDSDGTNVFVRMRLRGDPSSKNGGYASTNYVVSIGVGGVQSAVIGLNGKPSAVDFVYAGNADGTVIREVYATPFTNDGAGTSAGARWMAAPDEGYFVDFQIPIAAVTAVAPSVTPETPIQLFFGTSQAANLSVINKDFMIGSDVSYVGLSTVTLSGAPAGTAPQAVDDSATVAEDASVLIDVAANDTDVDGDLDPATTAIDVFPSNGSLANNGDGTLTYTPDLDYYGPDSFTYTVCDGGGLCDTAMVSVTVDPVADAPVASPDSTAVVEDGSAVIDVVANDLDVDGNLDPAAVAVAMPAEHGTVAANGDGTITYTPDPDYYGPDSFTYRVCDSGGLCDTAAVSVTVDPANDQPVAGDDVFSLPEDTAAVLDVLANDSDVDGDALIISVFDAVSAAGGSVSCAAGTCNYTPPPDFSGTDSFGYTIDDGNGGSDTATVNLTVVGVNDAPGVVDDDVSTSEDASLVISVLGNDTDPEGDALAIDFVTQPPNGAVTDNGDGTLTYSPDPDYNGTDSFIYRACDDGTPSLCDDAVVTVTVAPVNDLPVAGADAVATDEDVSVVFDVLANDFDVEGGVLSVSAYDATSAAGGSVTCTAAGICTYDPPPLYSGSDSFSYTVDDGNGGVDTVTVTIEIGPVNNRPIATNDSAAATEDTSATFPAASLLGNDSDPDTDPLTITSVTGGARGTASVVGGDIVYVPAADFNGTDTITYTACDPGGLCDTADIAIIVAAVNDDPIAKDDTATTDEDVPVTVSVLANDSDVDGDTLAVTLIATDPLNGTAVINGDNTITYTPAPDFFGVDDFAYQITDGNGGVATGQVRFVTVNPVNDAPVAAADAATVDEDAVVTIDVLANDSDVDDATLTVLTATDPADGTVADNGDGTVTYTPAPDFFGTDTFTYTVCDPGGLCAVETVSLTVDPVNDPPVAAPDSAATAEDVPVTLDPTANDSDVDGDTLTVVAVSDGANGSVVINGDGTITYSSQPDFNGSDSFTYQVSDGTVSVTETVTVTVAAVNDAPLAADDTATVSEDSSVTFDVVANDNDADGDLVTVVGTTNGSHGTVVVESDGRLTYTPDADFFGADTFTYLASDGTATVMGSVTVTVEAVNDEPVPVPDTAAGIEDTSVTVDVTANDTDIDGDLLAVVAVGNGINGSVIVNGDGTVTYAPDPDFFGTDSFTYTVSDGTVSVVGSVAVTITNVNDAPRAPAVLAIGAAPGGTPPPLPIDDPDGGSFTATIVGGALPAGLALNPDGTWSGEPTEQGSFEVQVEVCDPEGACTVMVLSIAVALLPDTGIEAHWLARLAALLVALGWWVVQWSNRRLRIPLPTERTEA